MSYTITKHLLEGVTFHTGWESLTVNLETWTQMMPRLTGQIDQEVIEMASQKLALKETPIPGFDSIIVCTKELDLLISVARATEETPS